MTDIAQQRSYLAAALCLVTSGCVGSAPAHEDAPSTTVAQEAVHPEPDVSFAIDHDTTVEVYDFPSGVLVMETGKAEGSKPVLKDYKELLDSGRLVEVFTKLRPDLEVPERLIALQAKAGTGAASSSGNVAAPAEGGSSSKGGASSVVGTDNACNNVCCDPTWLSNNVCNGLGNYPYNWFLLDYGWSYENSSSMVNYLGTVCAGVGTSVFTVNVSDGNGGQWSVPAGYYRWYNWVAGCYLFNCPASKSISTSVNSQSNQHLHSYCGGVIF